MPSRERRTVKSRWTFCVSVLVGVAAVLVLAALDRSRVAATAADVAADVVTHELADGVFIAEQVMPQQVAALKTRGFRTLIDLRPDGEAPGQPSAGVIESAAQASGLGFRYLPVPHGDIPSLAVSTLEQELATTQRPLLLYCRSGRRAARAWALAEASRSAGLDAAAISAAVQSAGQDANDLGQQIEARIATRRASP